MFFFAHLMQTSVLQTMIFLWNRDIYTLQIEIFIFNMQISPIWKSTSDNVEHELELWFIPDLSRIVSIYSILNIIFYVTWKKCTEKIIPVPLLSEISLNGFLNRTRQHHLSIITTNTGNKVVMTAYNAKWAEHE
jgi:hypothetical protein